LVDYVLACSLNGRGDFGLDEGEIAVDGFLEDPTLGLDAAIHRIFLHDGVDLLLVQEDGGSHVVVVLFDADLAACGLLPHAAVCCAKVGDLLRVLALVHATYLIKIYYRLD
jgi:hypothetical protein